MEKYYLIGSPVAHSKSPAMHNCAFSKLGIDAVYGLIEADVIRFTQGGNISCKQADGTSCQPRLLANFYQRNPEISLSTPEFKKSLGDGGGWYLHSDARAPHVATINRFSKVTMTSGQCFNDIPAGQSLDDIVSLFGASAYPELLQKRGGFMDQTDLPYGEKSKTSIGYLCDDYYWFAKHLSELTEEDLFLLDNYFYIVFDEYPDIRRQVLTLTFTDTDGKELTVTGTFTFPE